MSKRKAIGRGPTDKAVAEVMTMLAHRRSAVLTPERRKEIAVGAAKARWARRVDGKVVPEAGKE